MDMITIAEDFSENPAGRFRTDGPFSGEYFREDFLVPKLKDADELVIVLDGTRGYGSSFLEEAFGGLVRNGHLRFAEVGKKLRIRANSPAFRHYKSLAEKYMSDASGVGG